MNIIIGLIAFITYLTVSVYLHYKDYIYCREENQSDKNIIASCKSFIKQNKIIIALNIIITALYVILYKYHGNINFYYWGILVITIGIIFIPRFKKVYKNYYFTKDYRDIYVLNYLSPDYSISLYYKNRLKKEVKYNQADKIKQILTRFNYTNLLYTMLVFILFYFYYFFIIKGRTSFEYTTGNVFLNMFILYRTIARSMEITYAFYNDVKSSKKNSTLKSNQRIQLAVNSYIELILLFSMAYQITGAFSYDTLKDNIIRSFGIMTFTDIDLTYYNYLGKYIPIGLGIRILMILQIISSITLVVFSIAKYIGGDEKN